MSAVFAWHERGTGLELHELPGLVRVELVDDGEQRSAEFAPAILEALVDQLDGHAECAPADNVAEAVERADQLERERDGLVERATALETELRGALSKVETLKSAGALVDARMRRAHDEVWG